MPMDKLSNIFHFLKSHNKIKADNLEAFQAKMVSNPQLQEKVYSYLRGNNAIKADNIDSFREKIGLTLTDPKSNEPGKFKNRQEHDAFHLQGLLEKAKIEAPGLHDKYFELVNSGKANPADVSAVITAMGGLPAYTEPVTPSTPSNPTDWKNLGFSGAQKTGGYRYNSGQGKPAVGSTTNIKTGMRSGKPLN